MIRGVTRPIVVTFALSLAACGGSAKPAESGGAAPPPTTTESAPKAEKTLMPVDQAQTDFDDAQSAFTAAGNDCAALCKALASMTRATDHLCELAKDGDDKRCDDAKARLESASTKVKSTCGGCG